LRKHWREFIGPLKKKLKVLEEKKRVASKKKNL